MIQVTENMTDEQLDLAVNRMYKIFQIYFYLVIIAVITIFFLCGIAAFIAKIHEWSKKKCQEETKTKRTEEENSTLITKTNPV